MESRNNILAELLSLSPTLAGIIPVNPFQVPQGYFEELAPEMLQLVKEEKPSIILAKAVTNPYKLPDDYFEKLPGQMLLLVKDEELPPFLQNKTTNPYAVPPGYFEVFADNILNQIRRDVTHSAKEELESLSPILSKLDKTVPFSTPAGYFNELTENMSAGRNAVDSVSDELENLSPAMIRLKTENVYHVPVQYFESLPAVILDKIKKEDLHAKVVPMKFGSRKLLRLASAALIAGIILTAGLLYFNKQKSPADQDAIAQTEEKIQEETQKKVEGISDDEIVGYLDNLSNNLQDAEMVASSPDINDEDVKIMLADISDNELKQYLVENSDANIALTN